MTVEERNKWLQQDNDRLNRIVETLSAEQHAVEKERDAAQAKASYYIHLHQKIKEMI